MPALNIVLILADDPEAQYTKDLIAPVPRPDPGLQAARRHTRLAAQA